MFLLGIDIGTSGTKAAIFDPDGQMHASAYQEYGMQQPKTGWAEQNPEDWWQAVKTVLRQLLHKSRIPAESIRSVGLSGQMHGLVMLDGFGKVLRPCILWCDGRTGEECREVTALVGKENLLHITANPALPGFTAGKIRWVRRHEPEIYEKCRHILLPKDYIRYRLTGELASEPSDASGTNLLDVGSRQWSKTILERLDIEPAWLPRLYESQEITGTVTPPAAAETGLKAGTPVVGGAADNMAAALGTGVISEGQAFNTIGTSGVIFAPVKQPRIDPLGRVHTFCHAVPGMWTMMSCTLSAGLSLRWYREQFCSAQIQHALSEGEDPYDWINRTVESVPPGSNGLLFLPYLMGERSPLLNETLRACFLGISANSQHRDFLRAVMEGVSFSQRQCLDILRAQNICPEQMILCGGGGRSRIWRLILAALYDMPVTRIQSSSESGILGAAILAGTGTGVYADIAQGCAASVRTTQPEFPLANDIRIYAKLYQRYYSASEMLVRWHSTQTS